MLYTIHLFWLVQSLTGRTFSTSSPPNKSLKRASFIFDWNRGQHGFLIVSRVYGPCSNQKIHVATIKESSLKADKSMSCYVSVVPSLKLTVRT